MKNLLSILISLTLMSSCVKEPVDNPVVDKSDDRLIFSKNPNGHNELYKLENGEETVLLSDSQFDYWWAKVSPDKQKMLVYRSPRNPDKDHDDYENASLMLADIDGSNAKVIIEKGANGWNAQGVCRWNKDGTKILMCAEVKVPDGFQWRLIRTDVDGSNPIILSDRWALDCNFSPDDKHVVFMGFKDNNLTIDLSKLELQRGDYNASSGKVTNVVSLTDNDSRDHDPDYSPDGDKILFSGGNLLYSNVDLILFDVESSSQSTILDDDSANGGSMCWSPDGSKIYFHSLKLFSAPFRIKRYDVATEEVVTLLYAMDNDFGYFHPEAY